MKSIFKLKPEHITETNAAFKSHKRFVVSGVRQMAAKYRSPESAIFFFLDLGHEYPGDPEKERKGGGNLVLALGNAAKWKKHAGTIKDLKRYAFGTSFVRVDAQGNPESLVFQIIKGKAKDLDLKRKLRILKQKMSIELEFVRSKGAEDKTAKMATSLHEADNTSGSGDDLKILKSQLEQSYQSLGNLASPIDISDAEEAQSFKNNLQEFATIYKAVKDQIVKQKFATFAQQAETWAKKLQTLMQPTSEESSETSTSESLDALGKRIRRSFKKRLNGFKDFKQGLFSEGSLAAYFKFRNMVVAYEKEYTKSDATQQKKYKAELDNIEKIKEQGDALVKKAPNQQLEAAKKQGEQQVDKQLKRNQNKILKEAKNLNVRAGIKPSQMGKAEDLLALIERFALQLKTAPKALKSSYTAFFEQARKLRNALMNSLDKANADIPQNVQAALNDQKVLFDDINQLIKKLDLFNL